MKLDVFDERRNILGEGPNSSGALNEIITWVDIYGRKVRTRNILNGEITEYDTEEDVAFAIPRECGGEIIGTANGPLLRDRNGEIFELPGRLNADGDSSSRHVRWNDAKVSPQGDLFLGTMPYDLEANGAAFYQLSRDGKHLRRLFGDVSISNGLDWSVDGNLMYYIDTPLRRVDIFDVEERDIKNRRTLVTFPESMGSPDGMCVDSNNNLWIAFWMGSAVRCFDGTNGKLLEEILCPTPRITSCAFGGKDLDRLIISSASQNTDLLDYPEAGMIFSTFPGVRGQLTSLFGS